MSDAFGYFPDEQVRILELRKRYNNLTSFA